MAEDEEELVEKIDERDSMEKRILKVVHWKNHWRMSSKFETNHRRSSVGKGDHAILVLKFVRIDAANPNFSKRRIVFVFDNEFGDQWYFPSENLNSRRYTTVRNDGVFDGAIDFLGLLRTILGYVLIWKRSVSGLLILIMKGMPATNVQVDVEAGRGNNNPSWFVACRRYHDGRIIFINGCPTKHYIPIYLIVAGAFYNLRLMLDVYYWYCLPVIRPASMPKVVVKLMWCRCLIRAFLFVWLICGAVWVFGTHPDFYNVIDWNYCHQLTYKVAFIYVIAAFILQLFDLFCWGWPNEFDSLLDSLV